MRKEKHFPKLSARLFAALLIIVMMFTSLDASAFSYNVYAETMSQEENLDEAVYQTETASADENITDDETSSDKEESVFEENTDEETNVTDDAEDQTEISAPDESIEDNDTISDSDEIVLEEETDEELEIVDEEVMYEAQQDGEGSVYLSDWSLYHQGDKVRIFTNEDYTMYVSKSLDYDKILFENNDITSTGVETQKDGNEYLAYTLCAGVNGEDSVKLMKDGVTSPVYTISLEKYVKDSYPHTGYKLSIPSQVISYDGNEHSIATYGLKFKVLNSKNQDVTDNESIGTYSHVFGQNSAYIYQLSQGGDYSCFVYTSDFGKYTEIGQYGNKTIYVPVWYYLSTSRGTQGLRNSYYMIPVKVGKYTIGPVVQMQGFKMNDEIPAPSLYPEEYNNEPYEVTYKYYDTEDCSGNGSLEVRDAPGTHYVKAFVKDENGVTIESAPTAYKVEAVDFYFKLDLPKEVQYPDFATVTVTAYTADGKVATDLQNFVRVQTMFFEEDRYFYFRNTVYMTNGVGTFQWRPLGMAKSRNLYYPHYYSDLDGNDFSNLPCSAVEADGNKYTLGVAYYPGDGRYPEKKYMFSSTKTSIIVNRGEVRPSDYTNMRVDGAIDYDEETKTFTVVYDGKSHAASADLAPQEQRQDFFPNSLKVFGRATDVGTYSIKVATDSFNYGPRSYECAYSSAYVDSGYKFKIVPKDVTLVLNDVTAKMGTDELPKYDFEVNGICGSDTKENSFTGSLEYTAVNKKGEIYTGRDSSPGIYTVNASMGTLSSKNYNVVNIVQSTLSVAAKSIDNENISFVYNGKTYKNKAAICCNRTGDGYQHVNLDNIIVKDVIAGNEVILKQGVDYSLERVGDWNSIDSVKKLIIYGLGAYDGEAELKISTEKKSNSLHYETYIKGSADNSMTFLSGNVILETRLVDEDGRVCENDFDLRIDEIKFYKSYEDAINDKNSVGHRYPYCSQLEKKNEEGYAWEYTILNDDNRDNQLYLLGRCNPGSGEYYMAPGEDYYVVFSFYENDVMPATSSSTPIKISYEKTSVSKLVEAHFSYNEEGKAYIAWYSKLNFEGGNWFEKIVREDGNYSKYFDTYFVDPVTNQKITGYPTQNGFYDLYVCLKEDVKDTYSKNIIQEQYLAERAYYYVPISDDQLEEKEFRADFGKKIYGDEDPAVRYMPNGIKSEFDDDDPKMVLPRRSGETVDECYYYYADNKLVVDYKGTNYIWENIFPLNGYLRVYPRPLSKEDTRFKIDFDDSDTFYSGEEIKKEIRIYFDGKDGSKRIVDSRFLKEGEDYEVIYTNNVEIGTATATIKGKGCFKGEISYEWNIKAGGGVKNPSVLSKTYDGKAVDVQDLFFVNRKCVAEYKKIGDDSATYTKEAPKDAGTYKLKVEFDEVGIYSSGEIETEFTISPKTIGAMYEGDLEYNGKVQEVPIRLTGVVADDEVLPILSGVSSATEPGEYIVDIDGVDNQNYKLRKSYYFRWNITRKKLVVTNLSVDTKQYDGTDTFYLNFSNDNVTGVIEGKDDFYISRILCHTIGNNIKPGTYELGSYQADIRGEDGKYYDFIEPNLKGTIEKRDIECTFMLNQKSYNPREDENSFVYYRYDYSKYGPQLGVDNLPPNCEVRVKIDSITRDGETCADKTFKEKPGKYHVVLSIDPNSCVINRKYVKVSDINEVFNLTNNELDFEVVADKYPEETILYHNSSNNLTYPNSAGWFNDDVVDIRKYSIVIDNKQCDDYLRYASGDEPLSNDIEYNKLPSKLLEVKEDTTGINFRYQFTYNKGRFSSAEKVVVIKKDSTAPTVNISVAGLDYKALNENPEYKVFASEKEPVKIECSDATSGVDTIQYQIVNKGDNFDAEGEWKNYQEGGILLEGYKEAVVYAKVTDVAGNKTIVNTDGIIVFKDMELTQGNRFERLYNKDSREDLLIPINFNGNSISSFTISEENIPAKTFEDKYYTISENGIELKWYFFSSNSKHYNFVIDYVPEGYSYNNIGQKPKSLVFDVYTLYEISGEITYTPDENLNDLKNCDIVGDFSGVYIKSLGSTSGSKYLRVRYTPDEDKTYGDKGWEISKYIPTPMTIKATELKTDLDLSKCEVYVVGMYNTTYEYKRIDIQKEHNFVHEEITTSPTGVHLGSRVVSSHICSLCSQIETHNFVNSDGTLNKDLEQCECGLKNIGYKGYELAAKDAVYTGYEIEAELSAKDISSDSYTKANTSQTDIGSYKIMITGQNGYAGKMDIDWNIIAPYVLSCEEKNVISAEGQSITLEVPFEKIEDGVEPAYQWYSVSMNTGESVEIKLDSQTSDTFSLPEDMILGEYTYKCKISANTYEKEARFNVKITCTHESNENEMVITDDNHSLTCSHCDAALIPVSQHTYSHLEGVCSVCEKVCTHQNVVDGRCNGCDLFINISKEDLDDLDIADYNEVPNGLWVSGVNDEYDYTGKAIVPDSMRVFWAARELKPGKDYTVKYSSNKDAGTAKITITGKGNYDGKIIKEFKINKIDMNSDKVSAPNVILEYNNSVQKAKSVVTYTVDGQTITLKDGKDYKLIYDFTDKKQADYDAAAFKEPNTYHVKAIGIGKNFTGTNESLFEEIILEADKKSISNADVIVDKVTYTGNYVTPNYTVKYKGKVLVKGEKGQYDEYDYSLVEGSYKNNKEIGTASFEIEGNGTTFIGTKTVTFSITGTDMKKVKVKDIKKQIYNGNATEQKIADISARYADDIVSCEAKEGVKLYVADSKGKPVKYLAPNTDFVVSYEKNNAIGKKATIVFTGIGAYKGVLKKTYVIDAVKLTDERIRIRYSNTTDYVKGGGRPNIIVTDTLTDETLSLGKDYTVSYKNSEKISDMDAGQFFSTATIKGKGNYTGSRKIIYAVTNGDFSKVKMTAADVVYVNKAGICKTAVVLTDVNGAKLTEKKDYEKALIYTYCDRTQLTQSDGTEVTRNPGDVVGKKDIVPCGTTIKVTATAKGVYVVNGSVPKTVSTEFKVVANTISKAKVTIATMGYTGYELKPGKDKIKVSVKSGKKTITLSDDQYEIAGYENNINMGYGQVTLVGVNEAGFGGTIVAKFKIAKKNMNYTITYEKNKPVEAIKDVSGTMKTSNISAVSKLFKNAYSLKGYKFEGWNTKPDGTGISYTNLEAFRLKSDAKYKTYGDQITLYAIWTKK